ncbi:PREDICTED: transcription initiation factor TFIID subunit 3 [Tarenaya hassleriana]|uniref:transcription initiation factor TFIID subunit 3 n=1 Tax=Tarenaya hassleriana TaxID=28532 RepID=UPI00053C915D|nr:PREDICTED: transcription initiation factor TFIID subunit 3 [Tarenaya hassleriana]XP_010533674.1 PREDICTED: transcription initiation factor TFIID subunit 3 [Tarenaya hassleriana]XP_010533675.1 PREDICTED: transcription initiation factor TFIID subunit 3 [Tarenaya hassleriana]XP_010533676.1 PREDICTED: transcription initiation factor TFIID subunit 3 [Tarenaya hassleriana]
MEDQSRFNEKWDFRRKEDSFDDSSSDNSDSNSSQEPVPKKHKLVSQSQAEATPKSTTSGVSRKQPARSQEGRSKNEQNSPGKGKETNDARKKPVHGKGEGKQKEATGVPKAGNLVIDGVASFMDTLLDDLKASREGLLGWMKGEMSQSDEKGKREENQPRKRTAKRSVRKKKMMMNLVPEGERDKNLHVEEENKREEEQSKPEEKATEEKNVEVETDNLPGKAQEQGNVGFDCNIGPLERFFRSNEVGYGRNYFQQEKNNQSLELGDEQMKFTKGRASVEKAIPKNLSSASTQSQMSVVLAIPAPTSELGSSKKYLRTKKTVQANTTVNIPPVEQQPYRVLVPGTEMQKDLNMEIPIEPKHSSTPLLPAPAPAPALAVPSLSPFFPSNQGFASLTNSNFQLRPVSQMQDPSEIWTGSGFAHHGLRNLNGLYQNNNNYVPSFPPVPFHLGFNFQTQLGPEASSLRDNTFFGGLRMSGGAIRFSDSGFPGQFSGGGSGNNLSDYRPSSSRQSPFQPQNHNAGGNGSMFQN